MLNFRTLTIHRLIKEGEDMLETQSTGKTITGYLESATAEFAAIVDGAFGRTFRFFTDDFATDVRAGDKLIEGTRSFDVKGVLQTGDGPGRKMEIALVEAIKQDEDES